VRSVGCLHKADILSPMGDYRQIKVLFLFSKNVKRIKIEKVRITLPGKFSNLYGLPFQ
jgi:hypothetical protein